MLKETEPLSPSTEKTRRYPGHEEFQHYIELIKTRDLKNSKIAELKARYETETDRFGKKAEPFFEAVLARFADQLDYSVTQAPKSLDYLKPQIDYVMQLPNQRLIGIQLFSPFDRYDKQAMAQKMLGKYGPGLHWGIKPIPGFPEKTFGPAPIGFVVPTFSQDTIEQIEYWQPGQAIPNAKNLASQFFELLARSLNPRYREQLSSLSLRSRTSPIPYRLALEIQSHLPNQSKDLDSYSREIERLSQQLSG